MAPNHTQPSHPLSNAELGTQCAQVTWASLFSSYNVQTYCVLERRVLRAVQDVLLCGSAHTYLSLCSPHLDGRLPDEVSRMSLINSVPFHAVSWTWASRALDKVGGRYLHDGHCGTEHQMHPQVYNPTPPGRTGCLACVVTCQKICAGVTQGEWACRPRIAAVHRVSPMFSECLFSY
mmetsp:Transcript_46596/g.83367  ORF Transcript_46596/g.83367 Transcript_46596/m.83367 type:complete len:177 (-) Transcript_46596:254-784(-)